MASENLDVPIALLKEAGQCTKHPIIKVVACNRPSPKLKAFVHNLEEELQTNVYEASKKLEQNEATQEELRVIQKSETWEIVDLLTGKTPIAFECVFIKKYILGENISCHKARLVAKCFTQTHSIDCEETFASVAKFNTIKVLFSLISDLERLSQQLDVKNTILNGDLKEDFYMRSLKFKAFGNKDLVVESLLSDNQP